MRILRRILVVVLVVVGVFLVARAFAEPFTIDFGDPSTYDRDWGGPGLVGAMAVHMVPGLVSLAGLIWWFSPSRRDRAARAGSTTPSSTPGRVRRAP